MILRIKDVWLLRTAVEAFINAERDPQEWELLRPNAEILFWAILDYKKWQNDKWKDALDGRTEQSKSNPDGLTKEAMATLTKKFNDLSDVESQTEVNLKYPPVLVSQLTGKIKGSELIIAQHFGLIARTENAG
jgi:hypothetical protein